MENIILRICILFIFGNIIPTYATEELNQDLTERLLRDGVVVRVWSSGVAGGESVGHVSLQTKQDYISFWPAEGDATGYFNSMEEDFVDEERDPEIIIALNNPTPDSPNLLHQDFEFLKELLAGKKLIWTLNGQGQKLKKEFTQAHYAKPCQGVDAFKEDSHVFGVYKTWSFNCSSLVYNFLLNRNYLRGNPFIGIMGLNSCMAPDQVAQACSLSFLQQGWGSSYRAIFEPQLVAKGATSVLSFQEKYVGYYLFKTLDRGIFFNPSFLDDAARRINEVNDTQGSILVPLLEMFSSLGLSEALTSQIGESFKKK